MILNKSIFKTVTLLLLCSLAAVSCKDLLEEKPPDTGANILPSEAITSVGDLKQVLVSAYDVLANTYDGRAQALPTLLSDNVVRPVNQDDYVAVWLRSTSIFNGTVTDVYQQYYRTILRANTVIENLQVISVPENEARVIEAEARFLRALCHFDVARGWAEAYGTNPGNGQPGVAIRNSTTIENEERPSVADVYNFVLDDVLFAKNNLPESNDVFATKWAAIALEAEIRFQQHRYQEAYDLANELITTSPCEFDTAVNKYQYPQVSAGAVFYIYSADINGGVDSRNGVFRGNFTPLENPVLSVTQEFYNGITQFGGPRAEMYQELNNDGNTTYTTSMFEETFFHVPILNYTQMLLIRAESSAEIGTNIPQAIEDVNQVRERAYGSSAVNLIESSTSQEIIEAARAERRFEFPFSGQRFYDIKRIGSQGESIFVRSAPWDCPGMKLQFPSTERTDLFSLNDIGGC